MKKIPFTPQKDFLARLSNAGSLQALSELIWNGLDAGSDTIEVELERNGMEGLEELRVIDRGTGIYYPHLDSLFGDLGDSWKKNKTRENGRAIHGKKGQGRLKAFALGNEVRWRSTYLEDSKKRAYTIHGRDGELQASDPVTVDENKPVGTEVIVSSIVKSHGALLDESAPSEIAKIFAPYLSQYPNVSIVYDGATVDPSAHQICTKDIYLDPIQLSDGKTVNVSVSVVEWNIETKREIHLCDANGVSLYETSALGRIRAPGFHFTAYIKSDYFVELDQEGKLILDDLLPDVDLVLKNSKKAISKYFRRRLAERQSGAVERWKAEEIYPFEEKEQIDPVEEAERQVFDILAINVESYLPSFDDADKKTRKFTFKLIAQALKQNPESVQEIISGVLNLKKEDQEDLAELMRQTSLTSIISTAKTVANRLNFLIGLEDLLFDKESKKNYWRGINCTKSWRMKLGSLMKSSRYQAVKSDSTKSWKYTSESLEIVVNPSFERVTERDAWI
ncbi:ATP-binding protein [Coraliomargarita algicola]|uniref:ATP-binding protein n=1 Tax=Coraliomargarita algicola TaxID=3092156 RepID=A0ABZ0RNN3_9BACT|nr:ATP-binding protein [Coraliomargarita sp. J2-16]WPJ96580.1 ATP-binding protein [Coraliomargarita sp. J2-16]